MKLCELNCFEERLKLLKDTVVSFSERASNDKTNTVFPFENINELKQIGYHSLTIPKEYGGADISLVELLKYQEVIAKADGSTALGIGWHMGLIKHLSETRSWDEMKFSALCDEVVLNGALINSAASESGTGSPTRGGKPETIATKVENGWKLNGRKVFTTMSPILDFFVVTASVEDQVGNFLVPRGIEGVLIEETWDSISMRGTGSHDLLLKEVIVPSENLVEYITPGNKRAAGWLLHIPSCYLGIAKAAQEYAVTFAKSYSPNSIQGTISELPFIKQKIGEMELLLKQSEHFLYSVAKNWDDGTDRTRAEMKVDLAAVKTCVTNHAIEVVDLAMRVTGARSLSEKNPLQRYWRDVRAGLHNPPMDDSTCMLLAEDVLNKYH